MPLQDVLIMFGGIGPVNQDASTQLSEMLSEVWAFGSFSLLLFFLFWFFWFLLLFACLFVFLCNKNMKKIIFFFHFPEHHDERLKSLMMALGCQVHTHTLFSLLLSSFPHTHTHLHIFMNRFDQPAENPSMAAASHEQHQLYTFHPISTSRAHAGAAQLLKGDHVWRCDLGQQCDVHV